MNQAHSHDTTWHPAASQPSETAAAASPPDGQTLPDAVVRTFMNAIAVPVYFIGLDGRILFSNEKAAELPDPTMSLGKNVPLADFESITIHPDGRPCPVEEYPAIECLRTLRPTPAKTIGIRDADGRVAWVTASAMPFYHPHSGELQGVIATVVDISGPLEVEQSLKQTEDSYRRLVEDAPDAIVVHQAGKIVFINDAGVKLWGGKSCDDFLGRQIMDFVHPRYRAAVLERMSQVMDGNTSPLQLQRYIRLDGSTVGAEATAMPCVYEGSPSVQVILRDVTQRTRAERKVRKQGEILRTFFQRLPVLVGIFDSSGRCHLVNRQWKRVIGWGREKSIQELVEYCLDNDEERRAVMEQFESPHHGWRDFRARVRDGNFRELSSATVRLSRGTRIVIAQDVTRRKHAERELLRNQAQLEQRVATRTEELVRKNQELKVEIAERRKTERELQEKQRFLERMLNTHERDRQLVAYEIHDTFLQGVIGALMYIDAYYESRLPQHEHQMTQLETARNQLRKSIEEARRMISGLRPPIIDEQGVVAAIEYLISEMKVRGVSIGFTHEIHRPRFAPLLEAAVFRIVQEGLMNFVRHSQSAQAHVALVEGDHELMLTVRDFGVGFNPQLVGDRHFGLQGIKERARLLGGRVNIDSAPGEGTTVRVSIPLLLDTRSS